MLGALLGRISALHRFTQCSDGQLARLVDRYLSVPTDRHPHCVTISVVDKVRATSAWLDEDAKPLQFAAPDRELRTAGSRCVNDRFCKLRHSQSSAKNSPKTHHEMESSGELDSRIALLYG